jgi:hypothetical protein
MPCTNSHGTEKLLPLIIGKHESHCCFKAVKHSHANTGTVHEDGHTFLRFAVVSQEEDGLP